MAFAQIAQLGLMAGQAALPHILRALGPAPTRFVDTPYGQHLGRVASEGAISPKERRLLMTQAGRTYGGQASISRARIKGNLIGSGMEKSIAGQSLLARPGFQMQKSLGEFSERIALSNERTKRGAEERFALGATQSQEQQRLHTGQQRQNIVGGLGAGILGGVDAYQGEKLFGETRDFDQFIMSAQAMIAAGDLEGFGSRHGFALGILHFEIDRSLLYRGEGTPVCAHGHPIVRESRAVEVVTLTTI